MRSRAGPPARAGILRNRTRAGLVPEVDLIAPDKLSFPLPRLSRQSILKRNGPRHSERHAFPFCLSSCLPILSRIIPMFTTCIRSRGPATVRFDIEELASGSSALHASRLVSYRFSLLRGRGNT